MEYIPKNVLLDKFDDAICDVVSYADDYPEYTETGFSRELVNEIINSIYTVSFPSSDNWAAIDYETVPSKDRKSTRLNSSH